MSKETYSDWLSKFVIGKREVPSPETNDTHAVHSVRRYVDASDGIWEIARTYTGRLVVRTGKIGTDGITVIWESWITEHDVEFHALKPLSITGAEMKTISLFVCLALIGCSGSKVKSAGQPAPARSTAETATPADQPAASPAPSPSAVTGGPTMTCKMEKDERMVETVATKDGCELKYTKFGETSVIASSASGTSQCDRVRGQIKTNLERFGFKCE